DQHASDHGQRLLFEFVRAPGRPFLVLQDWISSRWTLRSVREAHQPVAEPIEAALERLAPRREGDAQGPLAARPVGRTVQDDDPRVAQQESSDVLGGLS